MAKRLVRGAAVEERHRENVAGQAPWQKGKPPQREGRGKKTVASRRGKKAGASKKKARCSEQEKASQGEHEKKPAGRRGNLRPLPPAGIRIRRRFLPGS